MGLQGEYEKLHPPVPIHCQSLFLPYNENKTLLKTLKYVIVRIDL